MKRFFWTLPLLVGAAALAQTTQLPPITKVGDVSLTRTRLAFPGMPAQDRVTVTASFVKGGAPLGGAATRDACLVQDVGDDEPTLPSVPSEAPSMAAPTFLDAGTPLVMRSGANTYAQLARSGSGARQPISYAPTVPTLPAPPAQLVLDVPGAKDGFPAFANVAVPSAEPPRLTAPALDEDITPTTSFRWSNPTGDANAAVLIMGMSADPELVFSCFAQDDGAFAFPAAFTAQLKAKGFEAGMLTMIGRTTARTVRSGNAALGLRSSVYEMLGGR